MHRTYLRFVLVGILAASPALAHATILLFDQQRDAATQTIVQPTLSGAMLPADYGDQVTSAAMTVTGGIFTYGDGGEGFTPDVSVDIFSAAATTASAGVSMWQRGYGDRVNVIFADGGGTNGAPLLNVRLTAAPGYAVDLYGFELAGFGSDYLISSVSVSAGANTLFVQPDVLVQGDTLGPRNTSFAFTTPLSAPELIVQVDLSTLALGMQDNVGMDNIRFGQTSLAPIPEPTSALLLLAGLGLTAVARKLRK